LLEGGDISAERVKSAFVFLGVSRKHFFFGFDQIAYFLASRLLSCFAPFYVVIFINHSLISNKTSLLHYYSNHYISFFFALLSLLSIAYSTQDEKNNMYAYISISLGCVSYIPAL